MATKKQPWAVLVCRASDDINDPANILVRDLPGHDPGVVSPTDPQTVLDLFKMFFTQQGNNTFNAARYFSEMSHGSIDLNDSQVFVVTVNLTRAQLTPPIQPPDGYAYLAMVTQAAQAAALIQDVPLQKFYGIAITSGTTTLWMAQGGPIPGGAQVPNLIGWAGMDYRWVRDHGTQSWGQEMGHGFGLDHSRRDGSTVDYMDQWDIMSTRNAFSASDPHYGFRGPGLNAANMRSRDWLDQSRVWRSSRPSFDEVIQLRPLHRHDLPGLLAAEFPPFGRGYIVEFRIRDRWDAAIPRSAILVHRFEDNHSYLMSGANGQPDLVEGDVFDPFPDLASPLPFLSPGITRVEVLQIDERSQTATLRLRYARASISSFAEPGRIIGGVAADGGGAVILGGRVVPVPPRDPMAQVLERIAAYRSTELISDVHLRNVVKRQALTEIAEHVQSAIEELDSFGAPEQRVLSREGETTIAPQLFRISGRIINQQTGQGVMGLRVEAWDKDIIFNDLIGSAMTDTEGAFRIEFSASHFQECFLDRRPDLFFKIFRGDALIHSTEDAVLWNVDMGETPVVIAVEQSQVWATSFRCPPQLPNE